MNTLATLAGGKSAIPATTPVAAKVGRRRLDYLRASSLIAVAVAMAIATAAATADDFGPVRYDPKGDQLLVTVIYDGTNPDHQFSTRWGRCRTFDHPRQPGQPLNEIDLDLLDNQGNDPARKRYTKTVRVPLAKLSCRPARVSLWTAPRFFSSVDIP